MEKKLTPKQKRFCNEYIIDLNGTQAAIRAGYSKKTARQIADQNLSKLCIKEYIKELTEKHDKPTIATQEEVLELLTSFARDESLDVKDRTRAAELLGKRYGSFTENFNVKGTSTVVFEGEDNVRD